MWEKDRYVMNEEWSKKNEEGIRRGTSCILMSREKDKGLKEQNTPRDYNVCPDFKANNHFLYHLLNIKERHICMLRHLA